MDFLKHIKTYKHLETEKLRKQQSKNLFAELFVRQINRPILIAEIKPRSPSTGVLFTGDPIKLAKTYEKSGVDAISVLTDMPSFGGSLDLFRQIKQATRVPLLRKDFIIDKAQLIESLQYQADAVLLIAKLLTQQKLAELTSFAHELNLLPIVEVTNEDEIKKAGKAGAKIIGVNARDLHTFKVNLNDAIKLIKNIPKPIIPLLFSGIKTGQDAEAAFKNGARGILVGTSLLEAKDIGLKIKELKNEK